MEEIMAGDSRKKSGLMKAILAVLVLGILVVLALPFFLDIEQFRPEIESQLSKALGREIKIGALHLSLMSGNFSANEISIADDANFSKSPFITANSLKIGIELKPLIFSREIRITDITLDQPSINLIYLSTGKWNFSDLSANLVKSGKEKNKSSKTNIYIKHLGIKNGRVSITEGQKKPSIYEEVNITAEKMSFTNSFPFTITALIPGEGTFKLAGNAGPLNDTDTLQTPLSADLTIGHLNLVKSGFVAPNSGISGLIDLTGTAISDGHQVQSKGKLTAEKLQVVKGGAPAGKSVSLNFAVNYDLLNRIGTIQEVKIGIGKAFAHLNGNFDNHKEDLLIKMKLHGSNMPVQDVQLLLPAFGVMLPRGAALEGGALKTELTAEGPLNKTMITGTAEISQTCLTGYDLSGKMALVSKLVGIQSSQRTEIEKFMTGMRYSTEGINVSELILIAPSLGTLSGTGKISPEQAVDFTMQAVLKPSGGIAGGLTRLFKKENLTIPFFVRGTASDPKFVPDVKNTLRGLFDSSSPAKNQTDGSTDTGSSLGDTLRNLFKKKQ
jgi:AsmA protein